MPGFGKEEARLKVLAAALVERLRPSIERRDGKAFLDGLKQAQTRSGKRVVGLFIEHINQILDQGAKNWVMGQALDLLPPEVQDHVYGEALRALALEIKGAGLELGFDLKVGDKGFLLSPEATALWKAKGHFLAQDCPSTPRSVIAKEGLSRPFYHRLSETFPAGRDGIGQSTVNTWFFACSIINAAQGWHEPSEPAGDPQRSKSILAELLPIIDPSVNLDEMLFRASYDDRTLLKLCSLVKEALDRKIDQEMQGLGPEHFA